MLIAFNLASNAASSEKLDIDPEELSFAFPPKKLGVPSLLSSFITLAFGVMTAFLRTISV